ncbi:hypothetical protein Klosneuvirus_3_178 [Klosneuvirus KNV1]|uniref:Uncharacterized protein n=1 Tax=Klosneuvirus KNV1 TaxID=1977640 RepID=A0A1V0SK09_9VIRU|nr:hypothetical protein Klosneuvirus_3_178 [Klosneuvirus KNV1]
MNNRQMFDYINSNDSYAIRYLSMVDAIERLQIEASKGSVEAKEELESIQREIRFYEMCRRDKIFRYIAKY